MKIHIVPPRSSQSDDVYIEPIFVRAKMRISICIFFLNFLLIMCFPCLTWILYGELHYSVLNIILGVTAVVSFLFILLFWAFEKPRTIERKYLKSFLNDNDYNSKTH